MNFQAILNLALFEQLDNGNRRNQENIQRRILRDATNPFELREEEFRRCFRLSRDITRSLVEIMRPHLKQGERSNALTAEGKVLSALAFFATGCYQRSIAQNIHITVDRSTLSKIITEVTDVMVEHLFETHIKFPQTEMERQAVKQGFHEKFNFPGIIGAIDCTHVAIIAPRTDDPIRPGLAYYNRKGFYSINVQMICDSDLKIMNCNARFPGSTHDSAIWGMSSVKQHLEGLYHRNELNFSWLIGDAGYPLQPWLLTPIEDAPPDSPEGRYTRQHILARNTIERCFGVLKQRFRCLLKHRVLHYSPQKAAKIVLSCAILHNFAIRANLDLPPDQDDTEPGDLGDIPNYQGPQNYCCQGRRTRAQLIRTSFSN